MSAATRAIRYAFTQEPALVYGLVNSVIALVASFGLDLSADQIGAVLAVTSALLALATRQAVTPVGDPKD